MKSWQKSRYDAILNFPKKYLISNYLGVSLSKCKIKYKFCLTWVPLYSQNSKFFVVMMTDLTKRNAQVWKTSRSYTRFFSVGYETLS